MFINRTQNLVDINLNSFYSEKVFGKKSSLYTLLNSLVLKIATSFAEMLHWYTQSL